MTDTEQHEHHHHPIIIGLTGPDSHGFAIPMGLISGDDDDEMPDLDQLPPELREVFQGSFTDVMGRVLVMAKRAAFAQECRKCITPEIANYVLCEYGDQEAVMPGLAAGALISLIRTCCACDDEMLMRFLDSGDDVFKGYVLAIKFMMESGDADSKEEGRKTLRVIAGLDKVPEDDDGE